MELSKLPVSAASLLTTATVGAKLNFEVFGAARPVLFMQHNNCEGLPVHCGIVPVPLPLTNEIKTAMALVIRELRAQGLTLAWVSEAWTVRSAPLPEDATDEDRAEAIRNAPKPANCPDRKECIMVCLYHGNQTWIAKATITREPTKLHDWELVEHDHLEGRMFR